ncbi:MAG TPA: hypothetical protein VK817_15960 [Trebonia sp.]|nr:hypothetical protein [Trebonia sp.]
MLVLREVLQFSDMRGTGWVMKQLTANGQPALAAYAPDTVAA